MLTVEEAEAVRPALQMVQIICGAMIAGVLFFMAAASVMGPLFDGPMPPVAGNGAPAGAPAGAPFAGGPDEFVAMVTWGAVGFAAVMLSLSFVLPRWVAAQSRQALFAAAPNGPEEAQRGVQRFASLFVTQFIIGIALCEGAAFFAVIAYFLGGRSIALATAVVMLIAIAVRFPAHARAEAWIERERENLFLLKHALSSSFADLRTDRERPGGENFRLRMVR